MIICEALFCENVGAIAILNSALWYLLIDINTVGIVVATIAFHTQS